MAIIVALALSVSLSPPFGEAQARAVEAGSGLVVEVTVEVEGSASAVLARGVGIAGELAPLALSDLEDGRWGGLLVLDGRENIQVAFEAIRPDADDVVSELHTLEELGVDPAVLGAPREGNGSRTADDDSGARGWLFVAVGAALVAVVLVGVWAARGVRGDESAGS